MINDMQSYICLKCDQSWYGILTECPNPECDGLVRDIRRLQNTEYIINSSNGHIHFDPQ